MVRVSHGNLERVRELLELDPALAKASYDWGFGDWESAIDAASHIGAREIAELLIQSGARPTLLTHAMLGHTEVVRATLEANPELAASRGPHGFTLLHHARKGGERASATLAYLTERGDANPPRSEHTMTEAEAAKLVGVYSAPGYRVEVIADGDFATIKVNESGGNVLVPLGGAVYRTVGAPGVRLRFTIDGERATLVRVKAGLVSFEATRT